MKKYLFIISISLLLAGAGCVKKSTTPATAVFSDPKANFTFEYPSNWVLNPNMPESEYIENKIYVGLNLDEYPDPCPVLDDNGKEVQPIVRSYMLNDKKHSVAVQMCGQVADISWDSAHSSISDSGLITISLDGIGVRLQYYGGDFSTTTQEFIDEIEKIIRSIRTK